jgi:hypothetical protein
MRSGVVREPNCFFVKEVIVLLFSQEEYRKHAHVHGSDGEAKFWLEPEIGLEKSYGLSAMTQNKTQ